MRSGLVIGEVALSLVLLLAAGLLTRSFLQMVRVDVGLDPANKAWMYVVFPPGNRTHAAERHAFFRQARETVAALPGVVAVAEATGSPLGGFGSDVEAPGRPRAERRRAQVQLCSEGYLRTFGLRLVRGRDFAVDDVGGARRVAIVNETLVAAVFGEEDAIGRTIVLSDLQTLPDPVPEPTFEIVGVVRDVRQEDGVASGIEPAAFVPSTTTGSLYRSLAVRTASDPHPLLESLRRALWALDPGVALTPPQLLETELRRRYAQPRFSLVVLASFAAIGLLLVGVGVYAWWRTPWPGSDRRSRCASRSAPGAHTCSRSCCSSGGASWPQGSRRAC